jgi:hypothetical protein
MTTDEKARRLLELKAAACRALDTVKVSEDPTPEEVAARSNLPEVEALMVFMEAHLNLRDGRPETRELLEKLKQLNS